MPAIRVSRPARRLLRRTGSAFRTYQAPRYGRAGCRTVRTCSFHGTVDHCRLDDDQQWTSPHCRDDRSRAQAKLSVTRPLAAFAFPSKRPAMRASGSRSADPTLSKTPAFARVRDHGQAAEPGKRKCARTSSRLMLRTEAVGQTNAVVDFLCV